MEPRGGIKWSHVEHFIVERYGGIKWNDVEESVLMWSVSFIYLCGGCVSFIIFTWRDAPQGCGPGHRFGL